MKQAETKPCVMCTAPLEPALDTWETLQPWGGGEVNLVFGYGSNALDLSSGVTVFKGVICDSCALRLIDRMECEAVDVAGERVDPLPIGYRQQPEIESTTTEE